MRSSEKTKENIRHLVYHLELISAANGTMKTQVNIVSPTSITTEPLAKITNRSKRILKLSIIQQILPNFPIM